MVTPPPPPKATPTTPETPTTAGPPPTSVAALTTEGLRARVAADLGAARDRTALLTDCVDDPDLTAQHSPLMSPLVWDLAHIGNQEELWLLRTVGGHDPLLPGIDTLYDAFEHPRAERPRLPLLAPAEARAYAARVRGRVLDLLDATPLDGTGLLADGFVFGMIAQHEQQHDETMLITHQLRAGAPVLRAAAPPSAPADAATLPAEVVVPGGPFTMGTSTEPWALDNERPAHRVHVPAFAIDTTPVTNAAYQRFIADGGYHEPRWWSPAGWEHRCRAGLEAPLFWRREGSTWTRRRFGVVEEVPPAQPVLHVCWYEAEAYARWAGRRLPTEAEWEKAARHDPVTGRSRRYPWGDADPEPRHANLGQRHLAPAEAGGYPEGASPLGVRQLIGDVWEWTASHFLPYPGFRAWPYREYSEVFFGPEHRVLRGGSFAVSPVACRGTFRNWDYPVRRQIFAGFRTARDAEPALPDGRRDLPQDGPRDEPRDGLWDGPPHGRPGVRRGGR
ncbi:ergothioneine biosynthesis protein EgtB [Allostreptomyces psammosilenae]|uniref:Hercynine oxygenase n=1 Tax=Allostreptomyces psammosilenae TaxID=1892865 RepID=A0A852ZVY5_9ACTN|nr:ergothioneine biosynthesis protein EgtB [Allostreptomyces psammosilenae]NYI06389.1 iron(II)-dependent oxidoreductase [Allostreptomyces psammosilenae]